MTETGGQPLPRSTRIIYAAFDNAAQHTDRILNLVLLAVVLAVLGSGLHIVKKEEAGVVVRFGKVIEEHGEPGIHFHIPIIDRVHVRAVKRIATHQIASTSDQTVNFTILSGDPDLFEVDVVLQYTINNLRDFLYESTDPMAVTTMLTRGHLVNIMGQNFIDLIFTTNREIIERRLYDEIVEDLEDYGLGVELVAVSIVDVRPIDETVAAFRDVSDAVAESIQAVSQANLRKERLVLRTQGQAEAVVLSATARARERLLQAQSSANAFTELLAAYRDEPRQVAITRYWNRMRSVLGEAQLAAVNPAGTANIDINMIDGIGPQAPSAVAAGGMPGAGIQPDRPMVATAPKTTHGLETTDKGLLDGRFHERGKERDHLGGVTPRSLLFDTLSIFEHRDVVPGSRFGVQQVEHKQVIEETHAEAVPPEPAPAEPAPASDVQGGENGGANAGPKE
ncbi:MAG: protease modulator HflK [Bryobacterales bacterium]|nr:protease modulator HflK [Bryobacterales bacterium]